eukprot:250856_1
MLSHILSKKQLRCLPHIAVSKRSLKQRVMPGELPDPGYARAEEALKDINFRAVNFSSGPSAIDLSALQQVRKTLTNYNDTGMGIIEMSLHEQTGEIQKLINNTSFRISKLLDIPQNYQIFFMHGGAHSQYAAVPLNICGLNNSSAIGAYVNTGQSSQRARTEATKFVQTVDVCTTDGQSIPDINEWNIPDNCDYIHLCANETVSGIEFLTDPQLPPDAPPLVGDFSSTLFSRPVDINKYGMIYASAGHNFGPSGLCICIVSDDLLEKAKENKQHTPGVLSWDAFANSEPTHSIYNTPSVFQIYCTDLILQKVYAERFDYDLEKVQRWVTRRANTIYKIIEDYPQIYKNDIASECRSMMNIPFRIYDHAEQRVDTVMEYKFLKQAEEEWFLYNLNGEEEIGGMQASLYTGIPDDSIKSVAKFMQYFADHYSADD